MLMCKRLLTTRLASTTLCRVVCAKYTAAFRDLQAQRRVPGASVDEDLAAAEHYMFARQMMCSGGVGEAQMEVIILSYDIGKAFILKTAVASPAQA